MSEAIHYVPATVRRHNLFQTMAVVCSIIAVLVALMISNLALSALGIPYDVEGGLPLTKIHPATYIASLAMLALLCAPGNPFIAIDDIVRRHHGLLLFLVAWLFLLVHISLVLKGPFTNIIDTFLLPPFLLVLLARLDEQTLRRLAVAIHLIFALNALLGIVELGSGWRLTPLIVSGAELTSDWRPSAIFGHPLANAAAIGCYVISFLLGGGRDLASSLRAPALMLQVLALVVFGGRAAAVLVIPFATVIIVLWFVRAVREKRLTAMAAGLFAIAVPLLATAVALAFDAGLFDQFVARFLDDDGSAKTRLEMFVLLSELPMHDLIFGPDAELITTLKRQLGLEYGIESFWVSLVAHYGLLSTTIFLAGLFCLCKSIAQASRKEGGWVVFYFILVASSSESIAAKTLSFTLMVILSLVLLRRTAADR